ncbi:reprolysin-like metallopeptidase [Shewanella denitrificans]|uniref:reprolysin-like metallopeptidase n=1 Tax=Shewanella denitrificans TaxID=192073 RepID=UPI0012FB123A
MISVHCSFTLAHEIGHSIGLMHQWNSTTSLMSYSSMEKNSIYYNQMNNLYEAYR